MTNNIKITTKYRCIFKTIGRIRGCLKFTSECPLYIYGIYPDKIGTPCNDGDGIIELDWVEVIKYKDLTNEYFNEVVIE